MGSTDRPRVVLELANDRQLARDLEVGGVFVPGCAIAVLVDCELIVRSGDAELTLAARVVFVDDHGAGLELRDRSAAAKAGLEAMARAAASEPCEADEVGETSAADGGDGHGDGEPDGANGRYRLPNLHERLRGLTLVQQHKVAAHGELSERIVLERIYGKTVWEPLLRNPRITGPEVARIARMHALSRPLVELIVGNGAWLQLPEVRRALLAHPRLGADQIVRVLRLLPKYELKLAVMQTAYPQAVRDAAKRLLHELRDR